MRQHVYAVRSARQAEPYEIHASVFFRSFVFVLATSMSVGEETKDDAKKKTTRCVERVLRGTVAAIQVHFGYVSKHGIDHQPNMPFVEKSAE